MSRYPWIIKERSVPPERPFNRHETDTCHRCGYAPTYNRKKCPACLVRIDPEAGHIGAGLEQLAWLAITVIAIVVLLRLLGVHV